MQVLNENILFQVIHPRIEESHKGDYGKVVIIGGNEQFGGAAIMAAKASVNAAAGLTTVATAACNRSALHAVVPEAMMIDYRNQNQVRNAITKADAIVLGPGLGEDEFANQLVTNVLATLCSSHQRNAALIIDGSAITILAHQRQLLDQLPNMCIIFTPHQMEWQRLAKITIPDQTETKNQTFAQKLHANVILKKHHSELYLTDNSNWQLPVGTAAMATGGMGDTLTGIIAAFCGQFGKTDMLAAIKAAVYLHSLTADELAAGSYVVLPSKLSEYLPHMMDEVARHKYHNHH